MKILINLVKFWCCCLMLVVGIYSGQVWPALAETSIVNSPIDVNISLGNTANQLKFFPDQLKLIAGEKYRFRLSNSSPQKHYFTAKEFASSSWTQKVDAGNVEIKGTVRELELRPGSTAEWVLVPMKPGIYTLRCIISGHTEAGMRGTITAANAS